MSARIDEGLPGASERPTRAGTRQRPRGRTLELRRPPAVYRRALQVAFARITVIDRLRAAGFARTDR